MQSGTYWFHRHSGFQEPDGAYGAIVIEPNEREPFHYDRDYVVELADAHPHRSSRIFRNLKMSPDYYNRQQRTAVDLFRDIGEKGLGATLSDRLAWGGMRMMPTDIEDVQGFMPVINGHRPEQNWTALFEPGGRVRLRFINSSAMAYFDIRIPGLKMTVVQVDGQNVQPVAVDELRIAVAESYDVIVRPTEDRPYTIFAESMGRTAYARGTLAPREGIKGEVPELREAQRLTMADMGMAHGGMGHGGTDHAAESGATHTMPDQTVMQGGQHSAMPGMDHSGMAMKGQGSGGGATRTMPDGTLVRGMDHSAQAGMEEPAGIDFYAPGRGLIPAAADGGKFLSYADLRAHKPLYPDRAPDREIELCLTGNMERYI